MMRLRWIPYNTSHEPIIERWLDEEARRWTGCTQGWADYYQYWTGEDGIVPGENFWVLLACEANDPCAMFVLFESDGLFTFSECIVDPQRRGCGIGKSALAELLEHAPELLGKPVREALAVILPGNTASQKIFCHAGFRYAAAHPDGDALYFVYAEPMICFCGHDCARCVTRLASRWGIDTLRERSSRFYSDTLQREISPEEVHCSGGRSTDVFCLCTECPFIRCCRKKGVESCLQCRTPCDRYKEYKVKYVNQCHQI